MKKFVVAAAVAGVVALAGAQHAVAADVAVVIDNVVISEGVAQGQIVEIARESVPDDQQGLVCSGRVTAENNSSVHPGNDLVVRTGGTEVTLSDVEGSSGKVTPLSTTLTLGSEIVVELVMGPDEYFSGGLEIRLECEESVAPPTTQAPTSTDSPTTTDVRSAPPLPNAGPPAGDVAGDLPATGPGRTGTGVLIGALLVGTGAIATAIARRSRPEAR